MNRYPYFVVAALLLFTFTLAVRSQPVIYPGKALLIEFDNSNPVFTVPEGKTWYLVNSFTAQGTNTANIMLLRINGKELNKSKYMRNNLVLFGNLGTPVNYPIIFPSNTSFELAIIRSDFYRYDPSEKSAYINVIETSDQ